MKILRWLRNHLDQLLLWFLCSAVAEILFSVLLFRGSVEFSIRYFGLLLITGEKLAVRWLVATAIGGIFICIYSSHKATLNIGLRRAGNGQFGTARFAEQKERAELYRWVTDKDAKAPGFTLEFTKNSFETDTTDRSIVLICPPGGGKTKSLLIPTFLYNARVNKNTDGRGASILSVDCKGEEYEATHLSMEQSGYRTLLLDFRNPLHSEQFNMLFAVNRNIDKAKAAATPSEQVTYRANAERQAKILSEAIYAMSDTAIHSGSESSAFFEETAKGLITAMSMLVSEFGGEGERHIISVFRLIIEMNGLIQNEDPQDEDTHYPEKNSLIQKNRLNELLSILPGDLRARLYAGAAITADVRTSMNIFSSSLSKLLAFIDAKLEQMICSQSEGFSPEEFIEKPTCIYLVMPDEDTTSHFFASLFIQQMTEALIPMASNMEQQTLPRKVLVLWDEFGQAPRCKNAPSWFTAWRSRGIRLYIALQSVEQLIDKYGQNQAKIILKACQTRMYSYLSGDDTAQALSKEMGNYTIATGSVNTGENSTSSNQSLTGRALMAADEISAMPRGDWLIFANRYRPIYARLSVYNRIWKNIKEEKRPGVPRKIVDIPYLTEEKLRARYSKPKEKQSNPFLGMFNIPRWESIDEYTGILAEDLKRKEPPRGKLKRKKTSDSY